MGWISPTGFNDPDDAWQNEPKAYDNDTDTSSTPNASVPPLTWGYFLELTHGSISCTKIAFWSTNVYPDIDIDVYHDGAWHDLYEGGFTAGEWVEKTLAEEKQVTKVRFRFYNERAFGVAHNLNEVRFWESAPTVVTNAITNLGIDHAHGNGTITSGTNATERGFEVRLAFSGSLYGYIERRIAGFAGNVSYNSTTDRWEGTLTKTITETGSFAEGAYEGDLGRFPVAVFSDKLFENETYDYRAYAIINSTTYYGDYVQFTTNSYPSGQHPDDQVPIEIIIPSDGEEPIDLEDGFAEGLLEEEEFVPEDFESPEFEYPDTPPYNGSWLGWFYYRKAYTKKDLDELRRKCRRFQDNMTESALVINHNVKVMQQFLNMMTEYMGKDEFNTFKHIIPTQHLNTLAHRPLDVGDFRKIINEFISNSIDNANNVNNNFELMRTGFEDYTYDDEGEFKDVTVRTKLIDDENPDVERLKKVIDALNKETKTNYEVINHNLEVTRAILIGGQ
jgi:hypothetical protein